MKSKLVLYIVAVENGYTISEESPEGRMYCTPKYVAKTIDDLKQIVHDLAVKHYQGPSTIK